MNLKDHVGPGKVVKFSHYRAGNLYYVTEGGLEFPVTTDPDEIGTATFHAEEKSVLLMRYIRKALTESATEREPEIAAAAPAPQMPAAFLDPFSLPAT